MIVRIRKHGSGLVIHLPKELISKIKIKKHDWINIDRIFKVDAPKIPTGKKYCPRCKEFKRYNDFSSKKGNYCKKCWKSYYLENKKRIIKNHEEYRKKNINKFNKLMLEGYYRNKNKFQSRNKTRKLLRGEYKRINLKNLNLNLNKECKDCGSKINLQLHHETYPIKLIKIIRAIKNGKIYYVCRKCHNNLHLHIV